MDEIIYIGHVGALTGLVLRRLVVLLLRDMQYKKVPIAVTAQNLGLISQKFSLFLFVC